MADEQRVPWETCQQDRCLGARLPDGKCLAHSSPDQRQQALDGLRQGRPLDVTRGVPITWALLYEILEAAPTDSQGRPQLLRADFRRATFQDLAFFDKVVFRDNA